MNVGKLHAAFDAIKREFEVHKIIEYLEALKGNLEQLKNQQNDQNAQTFKKIYSDITNVLMKVDSNFASPTRQKIFDEIGATKRIGKNLLDRISNIIKENLLTPVDA